MRALQVAARPALRPQELAIEWPALRQAWEHRDHGHEFQAAGRAAAGARKSLGAVGYLMIIDIGPGYC